MILYSVKVVFDEVLVEGMDKIVEGQLCESLTSKLNEKYGVNHVVSHNVRDEDDNLFIASNNALWIKEFLLESKRVLQDHNISFAYIISLLDTIDFIQESEQSEIQDTIDYISSFVKIGSDLVEDGYIITELNYVHDIEGVLCNVSLKAQRLDKLRITLAIELDNEELHETGKVIGWLENEYKIIVNAINKVTKDEE